jgi:hypothetical protein
MSGKNEPFADQFDKDLMPELIDLVLESLRQELREEWQVDAEYTQKLKSHLCRNVASFQERFVKGYNVLLDGVSKEES